MYTINCLHLSTIWMLFMTTHMLVQVHILVSHVPQGKHGYMYTQLVGVIFLFFSFLFKFFWSSPPFLKFPHLHLPPPSLELYFLKHLWPQICV